MGVEWRNARVPGEDSWLERGSWFGAVYKWNRAR